MSTENEAHSAVLGSSNLSGLPFSLLWLSHAFSYCTSVSLLILYCTDTILWLVLRLQLILRANPIQFLECIVISPRSSELFIAAAACYLINRSYPRYQHQEPPRPDKETRSVVDIFIVDIVVLFFNFFFNFFFFDFFVFFFFFISLPLLSPSPSPPPPHPLLTLIHPSQNSPPSSNSAWESAPSHSVPVPVPDPDPLPVPGEGREEVPDPDHRTTIPPPLHFPLHLPFPADEDADDGDGGADENSPAGEIQNWVFHLLLQLRLLLFLVC